MRRWLPLRTSRYAYSRSPRSRCLSTIASAFHDVERVSVRCGSSGHVLVDLHNIAKISSSEPLLVYLPPYVSTGGITQLPKFCQGYATAVIHYRWTGASPEEKENASTGLDEDGGSNDFFHPGWPAPIHDTLKAYSWITQNLTPPTYTRRDIYVYGSHLGASLATSLALTETHPHERMGVRGCIAYNGIYNWTMFLPDHPINKLPNLRSINVLEEILAQPGDPSFQDLKHQAEELFKKPDNLFDPFASPCLFFHTPGLLVPPSFDASAIPPESASSTSSALLEGAMLGTSSTNTFKPPRRSPLGFPPRQSTLKIPEMLLLHDTPPPLPPSLLRRRQRRKKEFLGNSFGAQAEELARLMQRSINKIEMKERLKWDDSFDGLDEEANRRVQVYDVGVNAGCGGLYGEGSDLAAMWLDERIAKRY
ncbi:Uu.00g127430.m01.CDS01 [Anthostomella pinea]|uniref:Uu.00g127430.m01.CDS01 n=1 Tax=Anthostomella pinea TaxID=933095 RepID=A0AAI8VJ82_9PEZI|nr:Uu.00g127430.m01.CDS01 [Anthostomella pinea]